MVGHGFVGRMVVLGWEVDGYLRLGLHLSCAGFYRFLRVGSARLGTGYDGVAAAFFGLRNAL